MKLPVSLPRRRFALAALAATSLPTALSGCAQMGAPALAQGEGQSETMEQLRRAQLRTTQAMSGSISLAPRSATPGVWFDRAPLPVPRTEMSFVAVLDNKMYVVGGYDHRGGFAGTWNHRYDPDTNRWTQLAPVPRGGNHVGLVAHDGKLYTFGGFTNQNNTPYDDCFVYDPATDRWAPTVKLPIPLGAVAAVSLRGRIHLIGGRHTVSVGNHWVFDPATNRFEDRAPIPGARDHHGVLVVNETIHVIGGRFNTFEFNTPTHLVYAPNNNQWKERAPMPTSRSGHGAVWYRDRIYCMGGEGALVYAQVESYDLVSNTWESHTPMATPRHGVGAAVLNDAIYVAGGGPVVGGTLLTSTHEAFTVDTALPARLGARAL